MGAPQNPSTNGQPAGASISGVLTALQNLVQAVNGVTQNYINVQGAQTALNVSAAAVIKVGAGRLCQISVTTAGTTAGVAYDSSQTTDTTAPIYSIPAVEALYTINWPVGLGIMVVPGTGQVMSVSYS